MKNEPSTEEKIADVLANDALEGKARMAEIDATINRLVEANKVHGQRERSLAITKLQEARFWISEMSIGTAIR